MVSNSGHEQGFSSTTCGSLAQRSGSRTWSSSHRSGRGEVETLQFDRGGSDTERRGGVDVEWATCLATRMFVLCQDLSPCAIIPGLSLLQRSRPGVLPCRPRALRDAARVHRVRITPAHWQWRPSWWIPNTELWRLGMSNAVVHSAVALLTTFPLAVLNSRVGVGMWKLPSVMASMLLEQRVSSLPGNHHVPGVNEEQQGVCDLRLGFGERHRCGEFFFFLKNNYSFWKFENKSPLFFLLPRRTTFFSCAEDCFAWLKALLSTLLRAVTLLSELSPRTFSCHWSGPRWHPLHQAVFHLIFFEKEHTRKQAE